MSETPVPVPDKGGWIDGETGPVFGGPSPEPEPQITRTDTQPDKAEPKAEPKADKEKR